MERAIPAAMFVSLVVVGLVAGIFLATQLGQLRVQNTLDARDFTLVKHGFEVAVGKVMPVLVIAAGVSIALLVFLLPTGELGGAPRSMASRTDDQNTSRDRRVRSHCVCCGVAQHRSVNRCQRIRRRRTRS